MTQNARGTTPAGTTGLILNEPLLWEKGRPGRSAMSIPSPTLPPAPPLPPELAGDGAPWPDLSELEVVRHYTRLSTWNFGVDTGMYPLGSCTMKYNPKLNEAVAALPGFAAAHPLLPAEACQGALRVLYETERLLASLVGLKAASLQPAAGAHGELTGMLMIAAYHRHHKTGRRQILMPDTAHGTNPATATMCGFEEVRLPLGPDGRLRAADVAEAIAGCDSLAGLMVTNPNTLGIFESELPEIAKLVHDAGGLVYGDGANLNAIMGRVDMEKTGIDVIHFNLHKSMSTPHGGGGPGSGPVAVGATLLPYLPGPRIAEQPDGTLAWDANLPLSIGRIHAFHGQFGIAARAYAYLLSLGIDGLREASGLAVLNANYVQEALRGVYDLPYGGGVNGRCMHECVFTDKLQNEHGVTTLDIAKRLIDLGYHPPTVYFPLVVHGAIMIEPTESESKEELDAFVAALKQVAEEAKTTPSTLHAAPTKPKAGRLDETTAARKPKLTGDM